MKCIPISDLDNWLNEERTKALRWIKGKGTTEGREAYEQGFEQGWHTALTRLANAGIIRVDESS